MADKPNVRLINVKRFEHGTTASRYIGVMQIAINDLNDGDLQYRGDEDQASSTSATRRNTPSKPDYDIMITSESVHYLMSLRSESKDTARAVFEGDDGEDYELILENAEYSNRSGSQSRNQDGSNSIRCTGHRDPSTPGTPAWTLQKVAA